MNWARAVRALLATLGATVACLIAGWLLAPAAIADDAADTFTASATVHLGNRLAPVVPNRAVRSGTPELRATEPAVEPAPAAEVSPPRSAVRPAVRVRRQPANRAPTAATDLVSVTAGQAVTVGVTANDRDPDGDPLQVTSATRPSHGVVRCAGGSCIYTPDGGFVGEDRFRYTVSDGRGGTASGLVVLAVTVSGDVLPAAPPGESDGSGVRLPRTGAAAGPLSLVGFSLIVAGLACLARASPPRPL